MAEGIGKMEEGLPFGDAFLAVAEEAVPRGVFGGGEGGRRRQAQRETERGR